MISAEMVSTMGTLSYYSKCSRVARLFSALVLASTFTRHECIVVVVVKWVVAPRMG